MHTRNCLLVGSLLAASAFCSQVARAQYPQVPHEIQSQADKQKQEADAKSDEAFAKAMPEILAWEKKGRPYIPWANHPYDLRQAPIPSFPGAEGGGMYSFGGRGGKVIVVTSLDDSGPRTFREACEMGGPRIVVFNVAGIIKLKDRIRIRAPYITIDGSSAPGDGVCIAGNTTELETHDVIIRHMRFRRGETFVGDRNDSLGGNPVGNIMIDHVSASWGLDENMSMYRHMYRLRDNSTDMKEAYVQSKFRNMYSPRDHETDLKLPTVNITYQNCIMSEGLNTYNHAFGSTIGGRNSTFHHNLWACNRGRNPSVGMDGDFGFVNNVIFNWNNRTVDGGDYLSNYNIINNYFKPGPATPTDAPVGHRILKPEERRGRDVPKDFGHAYVGGNVVEGNEKVTKDNWDGGVQIELGQGDNRDVKQTLAGIRTERPFSMAPVTVTNAEDAYKHVLDHAGATLPHRDAVDVRVIDMVRTGKVTAKAADNIAEEFKNTGYQKGTIDEIVGLIPKGLITNPNEVGGYPEYVGQAYKDSDKDGIPDEWEAKYGLNPNDPSDAVKDLNGDGYTNIEKFLYGLDPTKQVDWSDPRNNVDTVSVK